MSRSVDMPETVTTSDRVADAVRQVAHTSHKARMFQSMAEDALETGVHAARRSLRRRLREIEDLSDDAIRRIRRRPLAAVGVAVALGAALGVLVASITRRPSGST